ncbi:probable thiopurine S-methyltransferase isoform X2 [Latimeria chalumnae]|uniref:probable thiopurine S-methyltransferase isoform X2 n=1 Tax=Latimeria chalumnae TaxID=7897 RepID=UPI0003C1794D|nr:PREDICTED: thiopurine S-methyltransferase isoform X1 [Latimeria chalumnae]|eukprot:XP_006011442.1 PREDICTED: thiopurine S-methyltransferase isoform X1 [Latimeria chalumnae]
MTSTSVAPQKKLFDARHQEGRVMMLTDWVDRWEEKNIGFHQDRIHLKLKNNLDALLNNRSALRIYFPLCGKAIDMKWLADMGHTIVGVEVSEIAIEEFFTEQNLSYSKEPVPGIPGAQVFKSTDGNISLYHCDFFQFSGTVAEKFNGIWDRGSLVAINPRDRQRYTDLIVTLMEEDCHYLLDTFLYDPSVHKGPPFYVPDHEIENLFGKSCNIKLLESVDALTDRQRKWGLDYFVEQVHLITLKQNSSLV